MKNEEAVYFKNVCQIVLDNCGRSDLEDLIRFAIKEWDEVLDRPPVVQFTLNGESYSNAKLLKLWLYGARFHTDIAKGNLWNALPEAAQKDAELSVQAMAPKLVNCLVIVGSVIRWWREATTEPIPAVPRQ